MQDKIIATFKLYSRGSFNTFDCPEDGMLLHLGLGSKAIRRAHHVLNSKMYQKD